MLQQVLLRTMLHKAHRHKQSVYYGYLKAECIQLIAPAPQAGWVPNEPFWFAGCSCKKATIVQWRPFTHKIEGSGQLADRASVCRPWLVTLLSHPKPYTGL